MNKGIKEIKHVLAREFYDVDWMMELMNDVDIEGVLRHTCPNIHVGGAEQTDVQKVFFVILMGLIVIITHYGLAVAFKHIDDLYLCRETKDYLTGSVFEWVQRVRGNPSVNLCNARMDAARQLKDNISSITWTVVSVPNLALAAWKFMGRRQVQRFHQQLVNVNQPLLIEGKKKRERKQLKIHPDTFE